MKGSYLRQYSLLSINTEPFEDAQDIAMNNTNLHEECSHTFPSVVIQAGMDTNERR